MGSASSDSHTSHGIEHHVREAPNPLANIKEAPNPLANIPKIFNPLANIQKISNPLANIQKTPNPLVNIMEAPNPLVNIKDEILVELYDDAYYFWHPGTETFMSEAGHRIIGTPTAVHHWDVRKGNHQGNPDTYYMFWGQELHDKRKWVLDTFDHGPLWSYVGTYEKHDGGNQRLVLKSDGDEEGAKGLTISSHRAQHAAISMEKVNGKVQAFLRPRTGGKDQIFIPLRVQKQLPSAG